MIQTYIIREDIDPYTATKFGDDSSVCGDCPLKPSESGVCYVLTFRGPAAIYRSYLKHGATPIEQMKGHHIQRALGFRRVRLGAYGDPAAIPVSAWGNLLQYSKGWTGYTHQWRTCEQELKRYCQASCDSAQDVVDAMAQGWGTYYVVPKNVEPPRQLGGKHLMLCPFTKVGIQCTDCGLCNGQSKRHITVHVHGTRANKLKELQHV